MSAFIFFAVTTNCAHFLLTLSLLAMSSHKLCRHWAVNQRLIISCSLLLFKFKTLSLPSFFTGFGSQPLGFICTPVPLTHSCLPGSITCIQLQTTNRLQYSPGGRFCAVGSSSARKMKGQYIKENLTAHQPRTFCTTLSPCASKDWHSSS